jgi:hypothetical protein
MELTSKSITGGKKDKKKSSTKKPSTKKPSTKKPSTKKPSTKKPSTKKSSTKIVNPWLVHVKKTMKENPDKKFKDILKLAKKTYKK